MKSAPDRKGSLPVSEALSPPHSKAAATDAGRGAVAVGVKWYFVVIDTYHRKQILGWESQGKVTLAAAGKIAKACWLAIPRFFGNVTLGRFSVMPDHVRAVLRIAPEQASEREGAAGGGTLRQILGSFKHWSTRRYKRHCGSTVAPLWSRDYHARLIRSLEELALMQARAGELHPPLILVAPRHLPGRVGAGGPAGPHVRPPGHKHPAAPNEPRDPSDDPPSRAA